ncbi:putative nuclease HARBI1 [Temnothorax curvispinosus]|uniref:Nuclease HARBI1 n=1 Tax=Temnothorax curvispinosus TaxID=300111 RepID=A0A6J1PBV2_9HYME|nr:putative nuclease HARBI1 [Temnothorax curvispinosus]
MDYVVAMLLMGEEEEEEEERNMNKERQNNLNLIRRRLRDTQNPFDIPDSSFLKLYRLPKVATQQLIEELINFMPVPKRTTAIPQNLQIFATLYFLASGSYQRKVGQDFLSCMSQTSISVFIHATINAFNRIMGQWIKFPTSDRRKQQIKEKFFEKTGFPGVIGAIDGSHIAIFPSQTEREYLFINRKLYHSLNVMLVSSYSNEILAVNAMHGRRTHDSRVFRSSRLFHHLERQQEAGERGSWLIGDSAYPLMPFLLKPILNAPMGSPEFRYTQHITTARCAVERCIGILKGRWRCLRKERALHYQPEFAAHIVNACCVLHNIAVKWRIPPNEIYLEDIDQEAPIPCNDVNENDAEQIRRNIVRWYFE